MQVVKLVAMMLLIAPLLMGGSQVSHTGAIGGKAHGDGGNCASGEIPLGVDAVGAVQGCYEPVEADITDLAHVTNYVTDDADDTMAGVLTTDGLTIGNGELLTMGTATIKFTNAFFFSDDMHMLDSHPTFVFDDSSFTGSEVILAAKGLQDQGSFWIPTESGTANVWVDLIFIHTDSSDNTFLKIGDCTGGAGNDLPTCNDYIRIDEAGELTAQGTAQIVADAIKTGTLPGAVDLTAGMVDAGDLAANSVDSDAYADGSIDSVHLSTEVRSMYWGAGSMEVDGTQCAAPTAVALVTNGPTPLTIACADNNAGTISGSTVMPDGWNAGTVIFEISLGQIAAATTVFDMDFEGQCIGSTEDYLAFAGTGEQQATVTLVADDDAFQARTTAVTLNATSGCAGGDILVWRGAIDGAGGHTATAAQIVIVGVQMEFTTSIGD